MTAPEIPHAEALAITESLLSRGLDLCIRAQRLDQLMELRHDEQKGRELFCMSLTPALWVQDQYERDLEAWERDVRAYFVQHGRDRTVRSLLTTAETIRRELSR